MAYQIFFTDKVNKLGLVVQDQSINSETSLKFPGKNYTGYGPLIGENFLHLLENFANTSQPATPVQGQLWFDSSPNNEKMMVYNGANWIPVSTINKGITQPIIKQEGELWVDTENLQLFIYTDAAGWVLIGPQFTGGLTTGATPQIVDGIDNNQYNILRLDVNGKPLIIFSYVEFTPKKKIDGFVTIRAGLNLASPLGENFKYFGVAEKAESLIVNNQTVLAGNFLRSDAASTTNYSLNVLSNDGISLGFNGDYELGVDFNNAFIRHNIPGASVNIVVKNDGIFKTVASFDSSMKVGINKENPSAELDVSGDIKTSNSITDTTQGKLIITSTLDTNQITSGSITTSGGVGISKNLRVGENIYLNSAIDSKLYTDSILPHEDITNSRISSIGNSSSPFTGIYADVFYGNLVGNVTGSVTGRAGSANRLSQPSTFEFTGDILLANENINFTGQGALVEFPTQLSENMIQGKNEVVEAQNDDLLLTYRPTDDIGYKKIQVRTLLDKVPIMPIGSIIPFAGQAAPLGWLLCDGGEVQTVDYEKLFAIIGYTYKAKELLPNGFFAVPDLRGKFPLGMLNMGGTHSGSFSNTSAEVLGGSDGNDNIIINTSNLPEHTHSMMYEPTDVNNPNYGLQKSFYAVAPDIDNDLNDAQDEVSKFHFFKEDEAEFSGYGMNTTQGVVTESGLGNSLNILNPFLTLNYIIYAG